MTNQYNPLGSFDWEQEQTPEQQFRQYAMLQFTPGEARRALYSQQTPLLQRYLLRTPLESGAGGFGAPGGDSGSTLKPSERRVQDPHRSRLPSYAPEREKLLTLDNSPDNNLLNQTQVLQANSTGASTGQAEML